jgi:hypothetical protein
VLDTTGTEFFAFQGCSAASQAMVKYAPMPTSAVTASENRTRVKICPTLRSGLRWLLTGRLSPSRPKKRPQRGGAEAVVLRLRRAECDVHCDKPPSHGSFTGSPVNFQRVSYTDHGRGSPGRNIKLQIRELLPANPMVGFGQDASPRTSISPRLSRPRPLILIGRGFFVGRLGEFALSQARGAAHI